jgi:hypothetical protein
MPTPFFDFTVKISQDPAALDRFVKDRENDPDAAALTKEQRQALLSGEFSQIRPLLADENPDVAAIAEAQPGAQIGWNMFRLQSQILAARDRKASGLL